MTCYLSKLQKVRLLQFRNRVKKQCSMISTAAPYTLVDIGANLNNPSFKSDELDSIIERAQCAGVEKIIVTGTSVPNSMEALRLAKLYPNKLYCTAGLHPHDAKHFDSETLARLTELARNEQCVAIGECGLDFNRNFSPQAAQIEAFDAQVELACRLKKPLFVHEREAHEELVRILGKKRCGPLPPTVIHCFTGTASEARAYLDAGFYIGLTGFLWKDKLPDGVQHMLKSGQMPLDRLLLETDSPFMFPNLKAKKLPHDVINGVSQHARTFLLEYCSFDRNEPSSLPATCELIAGFMGVPADRVATSTTQNACDVFRLKFS